MDNLALSKMEDNRYSVKERCEICGASGTLLYSDLPDLTFFTPYKASFHMCKRKTCGAVWSNPMPDASIIQSFYHSYYTHCSSGAKGGESRHDDVRLASTASSERLKTVLRRAASLLFRTPRFTPELRYLAYEKQGTLLDVGCGGGSFLAEARSRGWHVFGQEFDPSGAEEARRVAAAEVRVGSLVDAGYSTGSFDAVTMGNVLEHLSNPNEVTQEVFRILKPGGIFVSISPNPRSFLHKNYREHWRGLESPRHLHLMPSGATKILLANAGFARLKIFSVPGEFRRMESASATIRAIDLPRSAALQSTSRLQLVAIYLLTFIGFDIGEWTVALGRKPIDA